MKGKYKKLITDITRDASIDENIREYVASLEEKYNCYAMVKMSLNFYTMKETVLELEDKDSDVNVYFDKVTDLVKCHILKREAVNEVSLACIKDLRSKVEYKMKNLTAFTDGYEVYEYILNRIEDGIKGTVESVNKDILSNKMFTYVFSENDTVVINSKLQLLMAQLPVRMTKMKFFDIVAKTMNIYESGEKSSLDEFVDMLRTALLIKKPEGFETEYPFLYQIYEDLKEADYKTITEEKYDELRVRLTKAADVINTEVSAYMLLQEIINDVYTILLTIDDSYELNKDIVGYKAALAILEGCANRDDLEEMVSDLMTQFMNIEGVQEEVYEDIVILEAALPDIKSTKKNKIEELNLWAKFEDLSLVSKLLSTSLFIDLSKDYDGTSGEIADHDYIVKKKDEFTKELEELFTDKSRDVIRSMMCKLLAVMPIFMNTKEEIKEYFDGVLEKCTDESELSACYKLISFIIEEE